jgi:hypothetical protein
MDRLLAVELFEAVDSGVAGLERNEEEADGGHLPGYGKIIGAVAPGCYPVVVHGNYSLRDSRLAGRVSSVNEKPAFVIVTSRTRAH